MTIKITLSQTKSVGCVPIIAPTIFKMPTHVARLKSGESRQNDYHKYFWSILRHKDSDLEKALLELADKAVETSTLKLYCVCGDNSTCHGNTLIDFLAWELGKRGFKINLKVA